MTPPRILNRVDPRRLIDRRGLRPEELLYAEICVAARCRYRGIQKGIPERGLEPLILFDDDYGSSLCLTPSQFTLENVRAHLAKSNAQWAKVLGK